MEKENQSESKKDECQALYEYVPNKNNSFLFSRFPPTKLLLCVGTQPKPRG
jgi:hypothetical protein